MDKILKTLKFISPALKLIIAGNLSGPAQAWLGNILIGLLDQATSVAASGGKASFSMSATAGVPLPPDHELTEDGIARWAEAHAAGPDDAA